MPSLLIYFKMTDFPLDIIDYAAYLRNQTLRPVVFAALEPYTEPSGTHLLCPIRTYKLSPTPSSPCSTSPLTPSPHDLFLLPSLLATNTTNSTVSWSL